MEKPPDAAAPGRERRRRLRAVFAADAANFGGLVSVDETKTLDSLWTTRRIATQELGKHGGWLFGMPGDGIFALFESSVDAVRCALDIQRRLAEQPAASILNLRVGIHLGEVLFQDELPFGEALVIAARLESLAEPGGILVSQSVMEAVAPRIQAVFVDQGVRSLKHSPRQIKTYTVHPPGTRKEDDPAPAEPLDLTLVPNIRTTTPAEAGTVRGPVRLAAMRPGASPVVEETPLPPPASLRGSPMPPPAEEPSPSPPAEPEVPLPERTVFLPGRRVAALLAETGRSGPVPGDPAEGPPASENGTGGHEAGVQADIASEADGTEAAGALEAPPGPVILQAEENPGEPAAKVLLDSDPGGDAGSSDPSLPGEDTPEEPALEVLPEPDFDPDRTVVLPRRALNVSWRPRPLPKASPFQVPEAPGEPMPEQPTAPAVPEPVPVRMQDADPAARARVQAAIPDVAQALTIYLGPIARVLVKRHAERCDTPQALLESVALEIPTDAERQAFRERAATLVARLA